MKMARKWLTVIITIGLLVLAGDFGFYLLHSSSNIHVGIIADGNVVQATGMNLTKTSTPGSTAVAYSGYNGSEQQFFNSSNGLKSILVLSARFNTSNQSALEYNHMRSNDVKSGLVSENLTYNGFVYTYARIQYGGPENQWSVWGYSSNYAFYAKGSGVTASNATIKALAMDQIDAMT